MKQSLNRHSSMFLMEIMIAILFFSLVSAICLRIFTASRQMGQDTNDLNMAVNQSENIAELLTYSLKSPESSSMDMKGTSGFLTSTYYIEVRKTQEESLCVFCIDAYKTSEKKKPVYSLNVSLHPPLHP